MRAVIQRVDSASVAVGGREVGRIAAGLLVLLAVGREDGPAEVAWMKKKILNLRVFEDGQGKMNRSVLDTRGAILVVSQFTLYGDCRKGNRPSFSQAAPPDLAERLYLELVKELRREGVKVESGQFQAMMDVSLVNQGPVTLIVESPGGVPRFEG